MSYKDHTWTQVAADYNSQLIRNYTFSKGFMKYPDELGIPKLLIAIISKKNAIKYYADVARWKECHEALKKEVKKDYNFVSNLIDKTNKIGEETNAWTKKYILDCDLTKLSEKELLSILQTVIEKVGKVYHKKMHHHGIPFLLMY